MQQFTEEWKPVVGYEGWYEVSDHGGVKRIRPAQGTKPGKILTPIIKAGYQFVALSRHAEEIHWSIHELVAAAFIGPRLPRIEINHIDGIKANNRLNNLEYVTRSENAAHAYRIGIVKMTPEHGRCKLTPDQVRAVRTMLGQKTNTDIGLLFGVCRSTIERIASGVAWQYIK